MGKIRRAISSVFSGDRRDWRTRGKNTLSTAGKLLKILGVLVAVYLVMLIIHGNRISLYYSYSGDGTDISDVAVDIEDTDVVQLISVTPLNGRIRLSVGRAGTGETEMRVTVGESKFTEQLSTKRGLICHYGSGNFPCWQFVIAGGSLFCFLAAIMLYRRYRKASFGNLFLYSSMYDLGLAVFFFVIAVGTLGLTVLLVKDPTAYNFIKLLDLFNKGMVYFSILSWPVLLLFAAALCVSNIQLVRKEGARMVNLLGVILSLLIVAGMAAGLFLGYLASYAFSYKVSLFFINSYLGVFGYLTSLLLAVFIVFVRITRHEPEYDKDFIVILGCAVRSDGTLYPLVRGRVDRAIEFSRRQEESGGPRPIFIPSGGKGGDEPVSEGEAMGRYLVSQGIPSDRVFPETRSVNTRENMLFSQAIAQEHCPGGKGAFSTTNYHVFRSGVIAGDVGFELDGMGAPTKWYFWPNALIREFIGLLWNDLPGVAAFCLLVVISAAFISFV